MQRPLGLLALLVSALLVSGLAAWSRPSVFAASPAPASASVYTVYFPLMFIPPWLPKPGYWVKDDYSNLHFANLIHVTSDGRYVDQHTMHFWTSECGLGDYTANSDVLVPIVNYQYSLTGPFYAAGTFTTPTAALITMGLANYQAANGCVLNRGPNTTTYHSTLPRRGEW